MKQVLIILTVAFLFFGFGWWANDMFRFGKAIAEEGQDSLNNLKTIAIVNPKKKTLRDYCSNDSFLHWAPKHANTTNYMCEITLHETTALYWYHGQCAYDYFTYVISDSSLQVLWSYRKDCVLNMDFLDKSNDIKKYPKHGEVFATMKLINDSTLNVKYNFPDWTKKINLIAKDSLFPAFYYLRKDN